MQILLEGGDGVNPYLLLGVGKEKRKKRIKNYIVKPRQNMHLLKSGQNLNLLRTGFEDWETFTSVVCKEQSGTRWEGSSWKEGAYKVNGERTIIGSQECRG